MVGIIRHFRFSHQSFLKVKEGVIRVLVSVSLGLWYRGRVRVPPAPLNIHNAYGSLIDYDFLSFKIMRKEIRFRMRGGEREEGEVS